MMLVMQSSSSTVTTGRDVPWKYARIDLPAPFRQDEVASVVGEAASAEASAAAVDPEDLAVAVVDLVVDSEVDLEVDSEVLVVEDSVLPLLVAMILEAHRLLQTPSLTTQPLAPREAISFTFEMFVFPLLHSGVKVLIPHKAPLVDQQRGSCRIIHNNWESGAGRDSI
jgi:hypothetical protein